MHRCAHRTDRLTRRILTLHAWNRLEVDAGIGRITFIIGIDADPLHFTTALHLLFSDDRDIVLRLARHGASLAAHAGIQVDGHTPGIARIGRVPVFVAVIRVERLRLPRLVLRLFFWIFVSKPRHFYEFF